MQMATLLILLTGLWASFEDKTLHDFHLSRSEINYDSPSATLQVTVHIFVDDLEKVLTKTGSKTCVWVRKMRQQMQIRP